MAITDALLPEFDHEMATTRRLLDRVPGGRVRLEAARQIDVARPAGRTPRQHSLLVLGDARCTRSSTSIRSRDARPKPPRRARRCSRSSTRRWRRRAPGSRETTDPELLAPWTLKKGDQEFFTMPRIAAIRSFVMNHSIHHRGQLSVYLRLNDVPLPPIYGPTADEQF